jgi:hypothetical protein
MPPAWVDFSWVLVQVERDDVKQISVVVVVVVVVVASSALGEDEAGEF